MGLTIGVELQIHEIFLGESLSNGRRCPISALEWGLSYRFGPIPEVSSRSHKSANHEIEQLRIMRLFPATSEQEPLHWDENQHTNKY